MMTRSEVARALRRSITTVRRIEGVHLHPRKDSKGVHRFERREVQKLQAAVAAGAVSLAPPWFQNTVAFNLLLRENRVLREFLRLTVHAVRSSTAPARLEPDLQKLLQDAWELAVEE